MPGQQGPVPGGIEAETRAMLDNVGRLLRAVGLDYSDVVKATVYLRDFADFAAMNTVYREYFPTEPPTRATVGVTALAATTRSRSRSSPPASRSPTNSSIATIGWLEVPTTSIRWCAGRRSSTSRCRRPRGR